MEQCMAVDGERFQLQTAAGFTVAHVIAGIAAALAALTWFLGVSVVGLGSAGFVPFGIVAATIFGLAILATTLGTSRGGLIIDGDSITISGLRGVVEVPYAGTTFDLQRRGRLIQVVLVTPRGRRIACDSMLQLHRGKRTETELFVRVRRPGRTKDGQWALTSAHWDGGDPAPIAALVDQLVAAAREGSGLGTVLAHPPTP
jgi:hypothetical protein